MNTANQTSERADAAKHRHSALSIVMEAFTEAHLDGLPEDSMIQAALFVVFQKLVACYGEEAISLFAERLPDRIRRGEFSVAGRQ